MKILIITTNNQSTYYVHAYETWKKSLEHFAEVCYYGNGYPNFIGWDVTYEDVYTKLNFIPDIELWCGGPGNTKPQYIDNKKIFNGSEKYKNIPKLILITDFWEIVRDCNIQNWKNRELELKKYGVCGYFTFYCQSKKFLIQNVNTCFKHIIEFPYCYDNIFTEYKDIPYNYDINLQWCYSGYPFRTLVHKTLMNNYKDKYKLFNMEFNRYKDCDGDKDVLNNIFKENNPVKNFSKLLNSSKITIADGYTKYISKKNPQWKLDGTDLFNARYPQVLASKSVLFSPIIESTHIEPLIDGVHYVCIDENNFINKIEEHLNNPNKLKEISYNANIWVANNCSSNVVGLRLYNEFKQLINLNN